MDHDKILDRIRKLLAMANDTSSPNEAAIAAGRARKLMDQYQVSELDLTTTTTEQFGTEEFDTGQATLGKPLSMMAVAVARMNDCQTRAIKDYNDIKPSYMLKFEGMLSDAVTATLIFQYLKDEMYHQAERNAVGRADRHAYRLGFASGIAKQVREIMTERDQIKTSTGTALVSCKQQLVKQQFGAARYKTTTSSYSGSTAAFQSGKAAGQRASLSGQVTADRRRLS